MYLKKAKPLDGLLRDHPSQRKTDDSPLLWLPRLSRWPIVLGAIAATLLAFTATTLFLNSREGVQHKTKEVVIIRGTSDSGSSGGSNNSSGPPIEVVDGDTVRMNGERYRLVGFDTPERGDKARCDDERQRAEKATQRLRSLISAGSPRLTRVACACRPGDEGTSRCNYGRLCGVLTVGGRDVGQILIGEGLAHPYVCSGTSCPKRQPWCDGR